MPEFLSPCSQGETERGLCNRQPTGSWNRRVDKRSASARGVFGMRPSSQGTGFTRAVLALALRAIGFADVRHQQFCLGVRINGRAWLSGMNPCL